MYDKMVREYGQLTSTLNIIFNKSKKIKWWFRFFVGILIISIFISFHLVRLSLNEPSFFRTALCIFFFIFSFAVFIILILYGVKRMEIAYKSKKCKTHEQYILVILQELLQRHSINKNHEIDEVISVSEKILASKTYNISWIYVLIAALALPYWNTIVQDQLLKNNYLGMAIITPIVIVICCYFRAIFDFLTRLFNTERSRQELFYNQLTKYKYEILVRQKQEQN
ncbi:hypothetical protein HCB21_03060 [Listeria booriae]|uniref:hypothetical protein n=1 Tax=Listeria booriae TaxID=1552123 RepID=UPI00162751E7|nr:hypothetical protein [Listeria booriae]MBC1233151.1 hypothetical protein [Listeria booriae]MBC2158735.1 hypothetical protein [Listeria booriae]